MRNPKPEEEINGTIGQEGILGNSRYPNGVGGNGVDSWIGQSSWVPGFLIVKKLRFKRASWDRAYVRASTACQFTHAG